MTDSNVFNLNKPEQNDPLQEVLRESARKMLASAIESKVASVSPNCKNVVNLVI